MLASGNILIIMEALSVFIGASGSIIAENGGIIKDPKTGAMLIFDQAKKKAEEAYDYLRRKYNVEKVQRSEYRTTEVAIKRTVDVSIIHRESQLFGLEAIDTGFAIHIKDPNIGKGKALQKVAELMKINVKEIAAIGDSENDIDMLKVSGFGIAVGNADEKTKKVADLVTKGSYGQGVLEAVNKLLGIC